MLSGLFNINKANDVIFTESQAKILVEQADIHGVVPLLYEHLRHVDYQQNNKEFRFFVNELKKLNLSRTMCAQVIHKEALSLLKTLNINDISYLVLKGFSLAYTTYAEPQLRPAVDIDIIIKNADIDRAKVIFEKNGYRNIKMWEPKEVHHQFTYSKKLLENVICHWDVHKTISNDNDVSQLLPFEEIYRHRYSTAVGDAWFTSISKPYAFIHASIHFLRHKYRKDTVRLVWLYDLRALANAMTIAEREELVLLVQHKNIDQLIVQAIANVQVHFQSELLISLKNQIQQSSSGDALSYLLDGNRNGLQRFIHQLKSTANIRSAITLITETLIPPKEQIYIKYGVVSNKVLWFFYLKRIVIGFKKWLSP